MSHLVGSHVESKDPFTAAQERSADVVQIHLAAPRTWRTPLERPDAERLRTWDVPVYAHAPYLVNPASINPEVRRRSRTALEEHLRAAKRIGARGLVVHGGHPTGEGTLEDAISNWVEVLTGLESEVPVLVENTAGGKAAVARHLDDLARLWERITPLGVPLGICLDTCHAHGGGEALESLVPRTLSLVGTVDLVHVNDSKDPFGSGRDRHENLGKGQAGLDLIVEVVRAAAEVGAPALVETPGADPSAQRTDIVLLRSALSST